MTIKTINDLDKLYDAGVKEYNGMFVCPVCEKEYKTKKGAESHVSKRDCYDLQDMFKSTQMELMAYGVYKELIMAASPNANMDIRTYRKSPYYNGTIRFVLFSNINEIAEQKQAYLTWLNEFKNCSNINSMLSAAIKESNLREFRLFLQKFPQFIESETYYKRHYDKLVSDGQFFIRSLEKAKVSLQFILNAPDFPFEQVMESMDADYQIRFEELANRVLTEVV